MTDSNNNIDIKRSSTQHMLWLVIGKATRSVFMLTAMVITARHLGPNNFGLLSFAISMTLLLALFPGSGLESVLTQELIRNPNSCQKQLGSAMTLYLGCSAISFLLLMAVGSIVSETKSVWMLIAVCGLSYIPRSSSIFTAFFDSKLAGRYIMFSEFIQAFTGLMIRLVLIWIDAGVMAFILAWVFDWTILSLTQWLLFNQYFPQYKRWKISLKTIHILLQRIFPLVLSGVMILIYQQIDKIMLKIMIDVETVGHYSLALRFVYAGAIIPVLGVRSLAPKLFSAREQRNAEQYNLRAQQLHDVTTLMSGAIMLALIVASPFIPYVCGTSFAPAVIIMIVASPLAIGTTMGAASGQQMLAENLQNLAPIRNAVGCGLNIILNFALIPHYKGVGAAVATVIASLMASFFCMALIPRCQPIFKIQLRALLTGYTRVIPSAIKYIKCKI